MQQRFKCVDIHNVKHAYVEREGSIYFIPSFLGLINISKSLKTMKNKWFLEDGTLKDEIIYPNKRDGVYLIKWEYYFFYLTSCSNDDILTCDYKRKLAKLVSSGEIGRRVNQFLEGDTVSNMIIDDTEHHDQNVLSQSSTCDIKIHDSPDFSQDTLNDVDMDDSFSQGTLNYVDMDQISDMDDSFSQGNITNFSQYSFESFGNNTQNSFASTSQDKNNLQLGNDFLSQLSSSEYDLSFGPINLDYELQEQQSNTIFIKDFLNEQKPLYPNTSSSHKQDNTNFKFFDLSTIKESTFGVESSYFKGISNRYSIKNRGTFKNVDMAEIHAIVNCFGNKYYPPTSSDKGRDLFKYTIPIIHQNLLIYMEAETNRTYESDLFDFLKSNCGQDLLLKYVSTKEKISGKLKNELKSLFTIELSPIDIIQSKDECEMSLNTLRNLIISLQEKIGTKKNNLYELLFGPSNVRKYNSLLNRAIEEVLGIKIFDVGENGSYVRIEDVLKLMIKAIIGNGGNFTNKNGKKLLKVRFSFDGREIPWAKIGFFLVPLGFSDIFPTQHWKSVFAFLLYHGEENLEDYLKYCDCILEFTCQDECIIQVDDEEYIIELILVPDLKALRSSKVTYSFDRVSKLDEQTINTILAKDLKINPTTLSKQQKLINVYKYVNSTSVVKNYTKWNKKQLEQELKNRNLRSSGSKDLLIHWLKEDDDKFLPIAFKQSEEYMVGMMDIIIGTLVEDTLSDEMKLLVKVPKIGKKRRRKKSKTNKSKKQKTSNNSSKKIDISDANQRDIIQDAIKVLEDKHKLKKQYKDLVQYFKEKGCNVGVFCPARSRHIRFSLMNPACHAFHVHYKYNTLFNIEAKAYCSLHACERIVESTLALTTNQKEEVRSWMINYFENTFNKEYLEDKGHTFKKKLEYYPIKLKPKNNILNEDTEDGFIKLSFSMILWKHCSVIVDTSDIWLKDLEEAFSDSKELAKTEPVRNLWNLLKELWVMLEYDSKAIEECKKEKFEKEWTFFKKFGNAFLKAFGNHSCTSHYLHIVLCHTVYVWENFGSLCILSNQGTESSNRGHKRIGEQMGQGAIKPNRHAVLQFQLRCLIYMIPEYRKKCNDYIESILKLKTAKKLSKNEKTQPIQMKSTQSTDKKSN